MESSSTINQSSSTPPKSSSNNMLIWLVTAIGFFTVATSGLLYAYNEYNNTPEKKLKKMVENVLKVKYLRYSGVLTYEALGDGDINIATESAMSLFNVDSIFADSSKNSINLAFKGKTYIDDLEKVESEFSLDLNANTSLLGEQKEAINLTLQGIVKENIYLRFLRFPSISALFDNSKIVNKWIKVSDLSNPIVSPSSDTKLNEASRSAVIKKNKEKIIAAAAYDNNQYLIVKSNKKEVLNQIETMHLALGIDTQKFINYTQEIYPLTKGTPVTEAEKQALNKFYKEYLKDIELDVWIGQVDSLPYKLRFAQNIKDLSNIKLDLNFDKYNEPFTLKEPSGAISFQELMFSMQPTPPSSSQYQKQKIIKEGSSSQDRLPDY
ncbi:MAG: hypothetical protein M3P33_04400 [bacterium]|nr:hypothetical protein [bacterium]